jgi:hypothetical protein
MDEDWHGCPIAAMTSEQEKCSIFRKTDAATAANWLQ